MNIVFRADAGVDIGIGHVMRCLTLADKLSSRGHVCSFVCRDHAGNLSNNIRTRGYHVSLLPQRGEAPGWLGATQEQDAAETLQALAGKFPDWVVTDHYDIGSQWELMFRKSGSKVLAIDDLADRTHQCDVLLDQTLGRNRGDYASLVPKGTVLLLGSQMALLRPRFEELRRNSPRREIRRINRILVSLGGADSQNLTDRVIDALERSLWLAPVAIDIVLGGVNPWIADIRKRALCSPLPMRVLVDVSDMAELILTSDLAIGTAGTTSWERCCLGLPSIVVVAADNQQRISEALVASGAATALTVSERLVEEVAAELVKLAESPSLLTVMSQHAASLVDGHGCERVVAAMEAAT